MRLWLKRVGIVAAALLGPAVASATITVTINPGVQYQVFHGWGATPINAPATDALRDQVIDLAVNDWGLTRLRLEPPNATQATFKPYEWFNDNGDPNVINWAGIDTTRFDSQVTRWILPFKQRVETNGDSLDLYISPSFYTTSPIPIWKFNSAGEYAEFAMSLMLRLRDVFGITANYYCICNEAGNSNPFTPRRSRAHDQDARAAHAGGGAAHHHRIPGVRLRRCYLELYPGPAE